MAFRIKWSTIAEIGFHILFWTLLILVMSKTFAFSFKVTEIENGVPVERLKIVSILPLVLMRLPVQLIFFYGNIFFLVEKIYKKSVLWYAVAVVASFSVCLYAELWVRSLYAYVYEMSIRFFDPTVLGLTFFFYSMFFAVSFSYFLLKEWKSSERRLVEIKNEQLSTELNFLRSQISPHFLFNTLNSLFSIAQRNQSEEVANGIVKISNLLRYMLYDTNVKEIPITKEIDYLRSFIELASMRFQEDEVNVRFSVKGSLAEAHIAPMLLIPFVENAFKHGVKIGEKSNIKFELIAENNVIEFSGENRDQSGKNGSLQREAGIGLKNVEKRLSLLYPDCSKLEYGSENGNFNFKVTIVNNGLR